MNTLFVLLTVIFAGILIVESFELDERLPYQQDSESDSSYISYKPKIGHKLRRKRDDRQHYCGPVLNRKITEVCNSCSKNPNTNQIKRKRDLSPFLEQKVRTKRAQGLSDICCKNKCTIAEMKSFCC